MAERNGDGESEKSLRGEMGLEPPKRDSGRVDNVQRKRQRGTRNLRVRRGQSKRKVKNGIQLKRVSRTAGGGGKQNGFPGSHEMCPALITGCHQWTWRNEFQRDLKLLKTGQKVHARYGATQSANQSERPKEAVSKRGDRIGEIANEKALGK